MYYLRLLAQTDARRVKARAKHEWRRASMRLHVTSSFSAFLSLLVTLHILLHADGEAKTDETTERDKVKSGGDRVQETELLVGLVHGGGWLIVSSFQGVSSDRMMAYVGLVVFLALQLLQPVPLKHDLGSLRTEPDQVQ